MLDMSSDRKGYSSDVCLGYQLVRLKCKRNVMLLLFKCFACCSRVCRVTLQRNG